MIADLKPYQEYKELGLRWLGQVPSHWAQERAKWLFRKMDRPVGDDDGVVTCFRDGMVTLRKNRRLRGFTEAIYELGYQGVRKGDLVIHAMDAFAGAVGVSDSDGKATPVYAVCQPKQGINASYYAFIIREMARSQWILALSRGIRERSTDFRYETFGRQYVPLPPPDEQAAIVRFLDWANGRLERAIRAKRKVIALLNEQKQAIIHRAVNRGLDPDVPLKPSGIPWLGDIPKHWEVRRLKFVASRIVDCLHATPRYSDSGRHPAIRTADVSPGVVHLARAKRISSAEYARWTARMEPREGDILYSREGERFGIAACVPAGVKLCISQRMMVFRIGDYDCSAFVMRLLNSQSTYNQALQDVMGATASHVNISTIRNYVLALPKRQEQEAIVAHVESEIGPTDVTISRLEREIELLREYRTRLVADVVTGKLDVRAAAAKLPEEAEDLELIEDANALAEGEEDEDREGLDAVAKEAEA